MPTRAALRDGDPRLDLRGGSGRLEAIRLDLEPLVQLESRVDLPTPNMGPAEPARRLEGADGPLQALVRPDDRAEAVSRRFETVQVEVHRGAIRVRPDDALVAS